jgi:enoyl-[acyl-carrier protein] reductase II
MTVAKAKSRLDRLWHRGLEFLGCDYALLGGAMTWISEHSLVAAISNGGGFGVLACGSMTPDLLGKEIGRLAGLTKKLFGVNLIIMHPELDALADVCLEHKVSHVVLAGGLPKKRIIEKLKQGGTQVLCFAPTLKLAAKLVQLGADALIIEGMEAGGHIGSVSTGVLAQEILPHIHEVPVFVAGGIGRGEAILSYLEMGASGCQLGTRFVCAKESIAHLNFKQAFIRANSRDAVASAQLDPRFPVIPVRALTNQSSRRFTEFQREVIDRYNRDEVELKEAQLEIEHFWAGALRNAVIDGDIENGSMMAGQSVGLVKEKQSTAEIIQELVDQAIQALDSRGYS